MLRALLLSLSRASWPRRLVSHSGVGGRVAARFVAGERVEDAIRVIRELNARGILASVDHLGESVTVTEEAARASKDYLTLLDRLAEAGVRANASLKLTQLGLNLSLDMCVDNLTRILAKAQSYDTFIRLDMEDSSYVERTLAVYQRARDQGFANLGVVLQAYLYRTEKDLPHLLSQKARIRLCKGAYKEPPAVAFPRKSDVDSSYLRLAKTLLDTSQKADQSLSPSGLVPPLAALATHDERLIRALKQYVAEREIPRTAFEFQMLFGIRRDLQAALVKEGYNVRVYVPYGTEWYPYLTRRLAERPANLWFFISNLFRR